MRNGLFRKGFVIGLIMLVIGTGAIPTIGGTVVEKNSNYPLSNGNTLYVGGSGTGNYTRIQDAINDASDGDTVFVYDDSSPYYENPRIEKSINLIGEDRNTTIIYDNSCGKLVYITADWVTISGFTISGTSACSFGIRVWYSDYSTITGNIISNFGIVGITYNGDGGTITDNIFTGNDNGIDISGKRNIIVGNTINGDTMHGYYDSGICLRGGRLNIIKGNTIDDSGYGIFIDSSSLNNITGNKISNNEIGILFEYGGPGNVIHKNNLLDNEKDAYFTNMRTFRTNRWRQNYWNKPLDHPKLIFGKRIIIIPLPFYPFGIEYWIPWFPEVDWRPAKEPYDI